MPVLYIYIYMYIYIYTILYPQYAGYIHSAAPPFQTQQPLWRHVCPEPSGLHRGEAIPEPGRDLWCNLGLIFESSVTINIMYRYFV